MAARAKPKRYRAIRRSLIAASLIVAALAGAALAVLFHDATLAFVLRIAAAQVAGVNVEFRGPVSFQWRPVMRLVAGNVRIAAKNDQEWSGVIRHMALTLDNFRLSGNRLYLTNLTIDEADFQVQSAAWLVGRVGSEPGRTDFSATPAMIESLDIEDVDILILGPDNAPLQRLRIDEIRLDDVADTGPLRLRGRGEIDGRRGTLDGELGAIDLVTAEQPYPVKLKLSLPYLELIIAGTIDDPLSGSGLNLALDLAVPDTSRLGVLFGGGGDIQLALTATARLTGAVDSPRLKEIQLAAVGSGLDLWLSGSIENPRNLTGLALDISAALADGSVLSALVELLADLPFRKIAGQARLSDAGGVLLFDDIELISRSEQGARLTAKGDFRLAGPIDDLTLAALALDLALQAPSLSALGSILPAELSELRDLEGSARLTGDGQTFALEGIEIRSGGPVSVGLTSAIPDLAALGKTGWPTARLTIRARDSGDLAELAGRALPSLGPVEAAADLKIGDGAVDLTDLQIGIGSGSGTRIDASGAIKGIGGDRNRPFKSLDLQIKAAGRTLGWLKPYLQAGTAVSLADALTRFNGTARMTGDGTILSLTAMDLLAHFGDTATASVSGRIGALDPDFGEKATDLALAVSVTAADTRTLGRLLQIELPDVGPLALTASMRDRLPSGIVELDPLRLRLDRIGLELSGSLANLDTGRAPRLLGEMSFEPAKLIALAGGPEAIGIGPARASIDLEWAADRVIIHTATLQPDDHPALTIGAAGDIASAAPFRHAVTLTLDAPPDSAQGLQQAIGYFPKAGLFFDGTLAGDTGVTKLQGAWRSGGSEAQLSVTLSKGGERPRLAGEFQIALADIADLANASTDGQAYEPKPAVEDGPIFSEAALPFQWLDFIDIDLEVGIGQIKGQRLNIENLTGQVQLKDRQFKLVDFVSSHAEGAFRFSGLVDARVDRPIVQFAATGDDLDLEALLWQFDQERHAKGALTIDFDLTATGNSPRQLAASLDGHVGAALEDGRFRGGNLHLLSTERFQWLRAAARPGKNTKLRCVIARMTFKQGIGSADSLLLVTPKMKISGTGRIDFHKEEMDITLAADRPTIAVIPAFEKPLRIHGSLANPTIDASLSGHAADVGVTAGEAVLTGTAYIAAPMIFIPLRAAGYLVSLLAEPDTKSACLEAQAAPGE